MMISSRIKVFSLNDTGASINGMRIIGIGKSSSFVHSEKKMTKIISPFHFFLINLFLSTFDGNRN